MRVRKRSDGFTLTEILVVVAMIAIGAAVASVSFIDFQTQNRARHAVRYFISLVNHVRGQAVLLSVAPSDGRVSLGPGCPAELDPGANNARAGLVIDATNLRVTYVDSITNDPASSPTRRLYQLRCKTEDLRERFRNAFQIVEGAGPGTTENLASGAATGTYVLTFDGRGFANNLRPGPGAALALRERGGREMVQRVLVLGSGYPCVEGGAPFFCARSM
jgi:prepilin-type N-terminal cleavage/methylation domain-containing protein